MTLTHNVIQEAADLLYAAQTGRASISPLTERYPGLNVADAYAIEPTGTFWHTCTTGRSSMRSVARESRS